MLDQVGQAVHGRMPRIGPWRRGYVLRRRDASTLGRPAGRRAGTRLLVPRPPRAPGDIIGRTLELTAIRRALLKPHVRLLTLAGPPGIGKTRLALALAEDDTLLAHFTDGAAFVDLAEVQRGVDVLDSIAEHLGLRTTARHRTPLQLQSLLRRRKLLLILDTFEHLLAAGPEVARLLVGCPFLKILVTSRAALRLRWEHVFPVAPLATPRRETPAEPGLAETYSAVALFVQRARAARPDFVLTQSNAAAVAELCSALDGVPLAIEVAASRCATLPLSALVTRMQSPLALLESGAADLPRRQRTLHSAIDWSVALLEPGDRLMLSRLGVLADGFTTEAAQAVCGGPSGSADVLDTLSRLIRANLLSLVESSDGEHRYEFLGTVRSYAAQRLGASGEAETVAARLVDWCLDMVEGAEDPRVVDRERANVVAALRSALGAGEMERGVRLALGLVPVWTARGSVEEGRRWLRDLMAGWQDGRREPSLHAAALRAQAWLAELQEDEPAARHLYERTARVALAVGDTASASLACAGQARLELACEHLEAAVPLLAEAVRLVRDQPSMPAAGVAIDTAAWLAARQGEAERATLLAAAAEQALAAAEAWAERGPRHAEALHAASAALGADLANKLHQQARGLSVAGALELCPGWQPMPPGSADGPVAAPPAPAEDRLVGFTRREREVLRLAALGCTNRQIADQLVVSTRTAEGHVHNILSKLQLPSRAQLAVWAARHGIATDDAPPA